jgi:two-component system, cell cycle sensor histidine kinase and response regulator CckA
VETPLRILQLEDDPVDAQLIIATLTEGGIPCEAVRVDVRDPFVAALKEGQIDMILADYSLPGFDGISALALARKICPETPFLFVSATLGEELAIDTMHRGATDYILKQRLGRLVPSVQRALRELHDRTERKRVEEALRQSEKQLRQAQKMEAVGRLAGGLAHDFNNLLTVIMGHSQVLLSDMGPSHPLRSKIEEMQKAGDRAATLIRQLLTFSRRQPSEPKVLTLNPIITNFEIMLRRLIGENIEFIFKPSQEDLRVKADPAQLEQVLMNLVVNARDAMPNGGKVTIETASANLGRTPVYHLSPLPPGAYVRLSVSDTGCGMPPDVQAHIFEPFFTTKPEGKGTGLGLSTVFGIVTQSGGGLDLSSTVGKGTRFDVYLPSVTAEADNLDSLNAPRHSVRGHETVLLAEDEASVRVLVRDELRKLGYRVFEAKDGLEACLVATQQMGSLQLLVTDVVMPGMSGKELAQHLRVIKPDLKLLYISGYTDDVGIGAGDMSSAYLQKPFTPEAMAKMVRDLLDQPPATNSGSDRHQTEPSHPASSVPRPS